MSHADRAGRLSLSRPTDYSGDLGASQPLCAFATALANQSQQQHLAQRTVAESERLCIHSERGHRLVHHRKRPVRVGRRHGPAAVLSARCSVV